VKKKNITISIDEELAKKAKILAAQKDTSVSRLLGEYLKAIVENDKGYQLAKEDFFRRTKRKYFLNYSRRKFSRDDLHER